MPIVNKSFANVMLLLGLLRRIRLLEVMLTMVSQLTWCGG